MATIFLVSNMLGFAEHTFISARAQSRKCARTLSPPPPSVGSTCSDSKTTKRTRVHTHTHTHTHTAVLLSIIVVEQPLKSSSCGIRADFVKTHSHTQTTNDHNKIAHCGMITVLWIELKLYSSPPSPSDNIDVTCTPPFTPPHIISVRNSVLVLGLFIVLHCVLIHCENYGILNEREY